MDTASEGGPWGMAVLAAYMIEKNDGETLADYLDNRIFAGQTGTTIAPKPEDVEGFDRFLAAYKSALPVEKAATETVK
jgi:CubicO group peptidase (beta-lactamase class C family)